MTSLSRLPGLILIAFLSLSPLKGQETAPASHSPIQVKDATADSASKKRIEQIYEAVGGFEGISIEVQSGVVTLSGEVSNTKVREEAKSIAERTDGVVLTINRVTEVAAIDHQLAPAFSKLKEMGRTAILKLPLFGIAIVLILVFWIIARLFNRYDWWLDRFHYSSLAKQLTKRIIRLAIILIGFVLALEILDATAIVGAILGAAGLAGLALGFAFKNIVENYLAGILLSTRNPFEIGDAVEIDGKSGKVARLTSRDTVLVTFDGNHLRIPNGIVMNSVLLNFSRNPLRRFDFSVGVSTDYNLSEAKKLGLKTLAQNPAVLEDPAPMAVIDSLGDSSVAIKFFAWVDQRNHDFMKGRSESIRLIKEAFDDAGIEMPEPIYRINLRGGELPEAPLPQNTAPPHQPRHDEPKVKAADISVDRAIDEQIKDERKGSDEENLLGNGS
ncbi:MAG: mechanosensitive ion channel family protein [Verrucomicrobiales bacterium]|nr:mechanosensitive ion channel family protein [Verrucomicrobiales bacterium]